MKTKALPAGLLFLSLVSSFSEAAAQKVEYPPEEFAARRQALCESLGNQGSVLMFGKTVGPGRRSVSAGQRLLLFHRKRRPECAFCSGCRYLRCDALPPSSNRAGGQSGRVEHALPGGGRRCPRVAAVHPLTYLQEFLARKRTGQTIRNSPCPTFGEDRGRPVPDRYGHLHGPPNGEPFGAFPSEDAWRIETLQERFPYYGSRTSPLISIRSPNDQECPGDRGADARTVGSAPRPTSGPSR